MRHAIVIRSPFASPKQTAKRLGVSRSRTEQLFRILESKTPSKREMAIREFEAHEWKKKPTKVSFTTTKGRKVRFTAEKEKRVPKHVRFKTRDRKRGSKQKSRPLGVFSKSWAIRWKSSKRSHGSKKARSKVRKSTR